jgi:hypothetical protein
LTFLTIVTSFEYVKPVSRPELDFMPANVVEYNAVDRAKNEVSHCTGGSEGRYTVCYMYSI